MKKPTVQYCFPKGVNVEEAKKDLGVLYEKFFTPQLLNINKARITAVSNGEASQVDPLTEEQTLISIGAAMEKTALEMTKVNNEVLNSKELLQNVLDDITTIRELVRPELSKTVVEIRENRMTVEREVTTIIGLVGKLRTVLDDPKSKAAFELLSDFTKTVEALDKLSENTTVAAIIKSLGESK